MLLYLTKGQSSKGLGQKFQYLLRLNCRIICKDRRMVCARLELTEMHCGHLAFHQMFGFFCAYLLDSKVEPQLTEACFSGRDADEKCIMTSKPYHTTSSK